VENKRSLPLLSLCLVQLHLAHDRRRRSFLFLSCLFSYLPPWPLPSFCFFARDVPARPPSPPCRSASAIRENQCWSLLGLSRMAINLVRLRLRLLSVKAYGPHQLCVVAMKLSLNIVHEWYAATSPIPAGRGDVSTQRKLSSSDSCGTSSWRKQL
jgi:hypothetical protein